MLFKYNFVARQSTENRHSDILLVAVELLVLFFCGYYEELGLLVPLASCYAEGILACAKHLKHKHSSYSIQIVYYVVKHGHIVR